MKAVCFLVTSGLMTLTGTQQASAVEPERSDGNAASVLVGATVYQHLPRNTVAEELSFLEGQVGSLEIRRVFDSGFDPNFMVRAGSDVGKRATHYSFKPDMAALASGALDSQVPTLWTPTTTTRSRHRFVVMASSCLWI
jgi:hypothetical protein